MSKATLGKAIRSARQALGITQAELAARLSRAPSAISMYERGERSPDYDTLSAIATALGTTPTALLNLDAGASTAEILRAINDDVVCVVTDESKPGCFMFFFNEAAETLRNADLNDPESKAVRDVFIHTISDDLSRFNARGLKKILMDLVDLMGDPDMLLKSTE